MPDEYAGRDGKAEAAADVKAGKPLQLYSMTVYGTAMSDEFLGLTECSPGMSEGIVFRALPSEADLVPWDDGKSQDEIKRGMSAVRFGLDYNREMYRQRTSELKKICPKVQLKPDWEPRD
jgi:hypothetical protein